MKNILFLTTCILCLTMLSCQQAGDAVVESMLRNEAESFNKAGPKMLDKETRMDSIGIRSGRRLMYYYTLVNYTRQELDTNVVKKLLIPTIKKEVIENESLKYLRDKKVDFHYIYYDKRGKYCLGINIKPAEYSKGSNEGDKSL